MFFKRKKQSGWLAIDTRSDHVDLAHVKRAANGKPQVALCDSYRKQGSDSATLARLCRELKLDGYRCTTLLGSGDYQMQPIDAPNVPAAELKSAVRWRVKEAIDYPLEAAAIVMGAGATFVARAIATDMQGLTKVLERAAKHEGTAFVEILQNCPIFNDGTWDAVTEAGGKDEAQLRLEHGKPLVFGKGGTKSIALDNHGRPTIVEAGDPRALVHDEGSDTLGYALSRLGPPDFPTPLGVLHAESLAPYERLVEEQLERARPAKAPSLQAVLDSGETWTVD